MGTRPADSLCACLILFTCLDCVYFFTFIWFFFSHRERVGHAYAVKTVLWHETQSAGSARSVFQKCLQLMPFWPLMSASSPTCFVELDLASVKNRLILFLRSETPPLLLLLGAWKGCEDFVGHNKAITCHRYGLWNLSCGVLDQNDTGNVTHSMTHKALFQLKGAHNAGVLFCFSPLFLLSQRYVRKKRRRYLPSSLSLNQTNFLWRTTDSQNYRLWFILRSCKWENQGILRLMVTLGFKYLPNINISPIFSVWQRKTLSVSERLRQETWLYVSIEAWNSQFYFFLRFKGYIEYTYALLPFSASNAMHLSSARATAFWPRVR